MPELQALAPKGTRRMSANPHANGGLLRKELKLPDFRHYAVQVPTRGTVLHENTKPLGEFLRDVHEEQPDELPRLRPGRDRVQPAAGGLRGEQEDLDGRLCCRRTPTAASSRATGASWRCCPSTRCSAGSRAICSPAGTGSSTPTKPSRTSIDSMFNQHAKWLDICKNHVPWRAPVASENILLSSTVWRQDHNGFSHQDPGFIDLVTNKGPSVTRIYLPPDANTLLVGRRPLPAQHRLHQRHRRRQAEAPAVHDDRRGHHPLREGPRHLGAGEHRRRRGAGRRPGVAAATSRRMEALAAAAILRERVPDLKLRFVNVVDLFKLQPASEHPHGSTEREFDGLFTTDKPIIFNFHGYPWLIHKLAYRFKGHENLHVRGYKEKGNINTPLELAMLNETSRFHLVIDVIDRVPKLRTKAAHLKEEMKNAIIDNMRYAHEHGTDRPEIADWTWPY